MPYARIDPRMHTGSKEFITTYDRTIPSELELAGISYAILMPKKAEDFKGFEEEYKDILDSTAKIKPSDNEDKLEK